MIAVGSEGSAEADTTAAPMERLWGHWSRSRAWALARLSLPIFGVTLLDALHKESRHEALADIRESIAELRHYRAFMGVLGGQSGG